MYNDKQENLHLQTALPLRSVRHAGKRCVLHRMYGSNESRGIANMAKLDLTKYGITGTTEVVYNPSYEQLFEEETKPGLEGYEKGQVSELGAVNVMTGIYTGRSPKDKFIVIDVYKRQPVHRLRLCGLRQAVQQPVRRGLYDRHDPVRRGHCGLHHYGRLPRRVHHRPDPVRRHEHGAHRGAGVWCQRGRRLGCGDRECPQPARLPPCSVLWDILNHYWGCLPM